jgi:hypothetical protein
VTDLIPPEAITKLDACKRCRGTGREPGLIPLPGLEPARLRSVHRDGALVWQLRCPECHGWADLDEDQLHGRVSIDHAPECGFHETHDLWALAFPEVPRD